MKKHLKDKEWYYKTIIIHKLVAQYKDNLMTENKPICFLVTIKDNYSKVMFRTDSVKELYKLIDKEGMIHL